MPSRRCRSIALAVALATLTPSPAEAYGVGPPIALEQLARSSDLVSKATVVADRAIVDPWFEPLTGYEARETELAIVSVIKGPATRRIRFRHYAPKTGGAVGHYAPQTYSFIVGRTYLVFSTSAGGEVHRQLSKRHTTKADQGVLLAADDRPHRGRTVTDAVWAELRASLNSADPDAVTTAIRQLDELSGGRRTGLADLDRTAALAAIQPMILHSTTPVATAAIGVFGADSPYLDDAQAPFWLAGMGRGTIPGLSKLTPPATPIASIAQKELLAVADGGAAPELRALALRALGRSHAVPLARLAIRARDPAPVVRRAAVLVSAELSDRKLVSEGAVDLAPEVRAASALAIGFAQDPKLIPLLARLLDDPAPKVREAAAMSLLSFAPDQARSTLQAKLSSDYRALFINALARQDPRPYLPLLAEVIEKQLQPQQWWGGMIPAGDSWTLLFEHVKSRPAAELTSGQLDASLDALERMRWFSSSEPRDLYALYLRRGLTARAKKFRDATRKAVSYNIDTYFDMADRSPETYVP
jgi:hypothetical protein